VHAHREAADAGTDDDHPLLLHARRRRVILGMCSAASA
jgi:hypothetical protein